MGVIPFSSAAESKSVSRHPSSNPCGKSSVTNHTWSYRKKAGHHPYSQSLFYKERETLWVLKAEATFKIAKPGLEKATTGFIASATSPGVKTAAVSGWKPNPEKGEHVLDNAKYFRLVKVFAELLNFKLISHQRDNNGKALPEHAGRFVQSHSVCESNMCYRMCLVMLTLHSGEETCRFLGHRRHEGDAQHNGFEKGA